MYSDKVAKLASAAGANVILPKPTGLTSLLRVIDAFLQEKQNGSDAVLANWPEPGSSAGSSGA
jgi:hypothetical protein